MIRLPDRDTTGFCTSEPDLDWTGFWKNSTGSDMDIQTGVSSSVSPTIPTILTTRRSLPLSASRCTKRMLSQKERVESDHLAGRRALCCEEKNTHIGGTGSSWFTADFWPAVRICVSLAHLWDPVVPLLVFFYGAPFVKILYLTDLAQKLLSMRIYSYLCTEIAISAQM